MPRSTNHPEFFAELPFPSKGINANMGEEKQPPLTCRGALNVRGFDPRAQKFRGAQREGTYDYFNAAINTTEEIQDLNTVFQASTATTGSLDVRTIKGVVVSNGTVKHWTVGAFTLATATNGSGALASNDTPVIFSAEHTGHLYFADGANSKRYVASSNTVEAWSPSAGSLPANGGERCRLICTWRGRIVMSGLRGDEHNWFMSAQGDPRDWDYSPDVTVETQAVAGNNSDAGKVGDIINALVPLGDDVLLFGGDHTIWQLTGDPMAGGRIDLITDSVGMAWGRPFCRDGQGTLYFVGSRGGVYKFIPGTKQVERISNPIDYQFTILAFAFDAATTIFRMAWDELNQGFYLFLTPTAGGSVTNYYFDARMGAWWPDSYSDTTHNPRTLLVLDGDDPEDRVILLGCQDSRVRAISQGSNTDDGDAISSYVVLGPIKDKNNEEVMLKEVQATMNMDTDGGHDDVTWQLYAGHSAQEATLVQNTEFVVGTSAKAAVASGTWTPGRNRSTHIRRSGHDLYLRISHSSTDKTWALERLMIKLATMGKVRQRQVW